VQLSYADTVVVNENKDAGISDASKNKQSSQAVPPTESLPEPAAVAAVAPDASSSENGYEFEDEEDAGDAVESSSESVRYRKQRITESPVLPLFPGII
jgi:hypothetical protein